MKGVLKIISLVGVWTIFGLFVYGVDPKMAIDILIPNSYSPFWALLGIALWYSLTLLGVKWWQGLIITMTIVGGLVMSMIGIMHWGLFAILILTLIIESWYIYRSKYEKIN